MPWRLPEEQAGLTTGSRLAAEDPGEAATAASLPAGAYTAILARKGNGTGIGLVEIYSLQQ